MELCTLFKPIEWLRPFSTRVEAAQEWANIQLLALDTVFGNVPRPAPLWSANLLSFQLPLNLNRRIIPFAGLTGVMANFNYAVFTASIRDYDPGSVVAMEAMNSRISVTKPHSGFRTMGIHKIAE